MINWHQLYTLKRQKDPRSSIMLPTMLSLFLYRNDYFFYKIVSKYTSRRMN